MAEDITTAEFVGGPKCGEQYILNGSPIVVEFEGVSFKKCNLFSRVVYVYRRRFLFGIPVNTKTGCALYDLEDVRAK